MPIIEGGKMTMYNIYDVLPYNCKDVTVKTVSGHEYNGRCHVFSEYEDDDHIETPDEYITINGGLRIDIDDILEISEISGG